MSSAAGGRTEPGLAELGDRAPLLFESFSRAQVLEACGTPLHGRVHALAPGPQAEVPATRVSARRPPLRPCVIRGVLLDLVRRARRPLAPGTPLTRLELDECAELQGVTLEPGDALLLRTGFPETRASGEPGFAGRSASPSRHGPLPGLDPSLAGWLRERRLALVGSDAPSIEARLGLVDPEADRLRGAALEAGLLLATDLLLEGLAADCAATGDYAFLLVVPAPDALGIARPAAVL